MNVFTRFENAGVTAMILSSLWCVLQRSPTLARRPFAKEIPPMAVLLMRITPAATAKRERDLGKAESHI